MNRNQSPLHKNINCENLADKGYSFDNPVNNSFIKLLDALDNSSRRKKDFNINIDRIRSSKQKQSSKNDKVIEEYNLKPLEDYRLELMSLMADYRIETEPIDEETKKKKALAFLDYSDSSGIHVKVENEDFKNINEAFSILKRNKNIHDSVLNKIFLRQQKLNYDKCNEVIKNKASPIKVKISRAIPKLDINQPAQNQVSKPNSICLDIFTEGLADMYGYYLYCKKNIPECREQFSLCRELDNILIFGGQSTKPLADLWSFNPIEMEFKKIISDQIPNARYGHSANIYQKKMFVFGGKIKSNLNTYTYLGDLEIFNLDDNTWSTPIVTNRNLIKLRRNHSSQIVGSQLIIYGGFSEENFILNDCYSLNLVAPYKWMKVNIDHLNPNLPAPYLAGHTTCCVFPTEIKYNPKFSIYKIPDNYVFQRRNKVKVKEKGIYFFGGKSDTGCVNDLWILRLGNKPLKFIKPECNGRPPCPRFLHSMNFYEEGNFLIVYGGTNENSENFDLGDIFILELSKMEWIEIKIFSSHPISVYQRFGHSALIESQKLIIFGGMNNQNFIGSSVFIIDLDSCYSYNNVQQDKKGKIDKYKLYLKELLKDDLPRRERAIIAKLKKKGKNLLNSNAYLPLIK